MLSATDKRRADIKRRYDTARRERQRNPVSMAALRVGDLKRLFTARYGREMPDDDAGRDDALVMAHHLARQHHPERRISAWLSLSTPWMSQNEVQALTNKVIAKPIRWRADTLGKRLNLTEAERQRLRITTIGAVGVDKAGRLDRRRERARQRDEQRRRAAGAKTRAEYEANSISKTRPWEALGMSRRTWYRLGKPTRGTSACAA
jgi:hypothetical protein